MITLLAFDPLDLHELARGIWRTGYDPGLGAAALVTAHRENASHDSGRLSGEVVVAGGDAHLALVTAAHGVELLWYGFKLVNH